MVPSKIRLEQGASSRTSRALLVIEPASRGPRRRRRRNCRALHPPLMLAYPNPRWAFSHPEPSACRALAPCKRQKDLRMRNVVCWERRDTGLRPVPFACVLVKIWERDVGRRACCSSERGRERTRERIIQQRRDVRRQKRVQLKLLFDGVKHADMNSHSRINIVDLKRCWSVADCMLWVM